MDSFKKWKESLPFLLRTSSNSLIISSWRGADMSGSQRTNIVLKEKNIRNERGCFFVCITRTFVIDFLFFVSGSTPYLDNMYPSILNLEVSNTRFFSFIFLPLSIILLPTKTVIRILSNTFRTDEHVVYIHSYKAKILELTFHDSLKGRWYTQKAKWHHPGLKRSELTTKWRFLSNTSCELNPPVVGKHLQLAKEFCNIIIYFFNIRQRKVFSFHSLIKHLIAHTKAWIHILLLATTRGKPDGVIARFIVRADRMYSISFFYLVVLCKHLAQW